VITPPGLLTGPLQSDSSGFLAGGAFCYLQK
jgi:hypothetical protein